MLLKKFGREFDGPHSCCPFVRSEVTVCCQRANVYQMLFQLVPIRARHVLYSRFITIGEEWSGWLLSTSFCALATSFASPLGIAARSGGLYSRKYVRPQEPCVAGDPLGMPSQRRAVLCSRLAGFHVKNRLYNHGEDDYTPRETGLVCQVTMPLRPLVALFCCPCPCPYVNSPSSVPA